MSDEGGATAAVVRNVSTGAFPSVVQRDETGVPFLVAWACGMKPPDLCLSENYLISPSFLKFIFSAYRILC